MNIDRIANYWDKQASSWRTEKDRLWNQEQTARWRVFFQNIKPLFAEAKVLEVGTASGYFANIMASVGYDVTAVDISPKMINEAREVSEKLGLKITYKVMDAQELTFSSENFNFIFTRLMTWTLPSVDSFYSACFRILKPGGRIINFDADYGSVIFSKDGHERCAQDDLDEVNAIKDSLEISKHSRPLIDLDILLKVGFSQLDVDLYAQSKILGQKRESSLFKIEAVK